MGGFRSPGTGNSSEAGQHDVVPGSDNPVHSPAAERGTWIFYADVRESCGSAIRGLRGAETPAPPNVDLEATQAMVLPGFAAPSGPGEFTRQFQAGAPKAPAVSQAPAPPLAGPGEFTQQFLAAKPKAPSPIVPQPPAAPPTVPGEFTQQFLAGAPKAPAPQAPAEAPAAAPPPVSEPGEFTRLFQAAVPPGPGSISPAPAATPEVPVTPLVPPAVAPVPRSALPLAAEPASSKSAFDQMFTAPIATQTSTLAAAPTVRRPRPRPLPLQLPTG